ncbi:MAG: hypothetical protein GY940_36730 [bacterium]|nr:hypothetical protein [bacterium]
MGNKFLEEKLLDVNLAITNAGEDPFISEALRPFAYTPERLKVGHGLCKDADRRYTFHLDARMYQARAWEKLGEAVKLGRKKYSFYRSIARMALRENAPLKNALGLGQKIKQGLADWLEQARVFYVNALGNPEILKGFSVFGVKPKDLKAAIKQLDQIKDASALHKQKKAATQQAVKERDLAFKALDAWMRDFWQVCRLALGDQPAHMRKLKMR